MGATTNIPVAALERRDHLNRQLDAVLDKIYRPLVNPALDHLRDMGTRRSMYMGLYYHVSEIFRAVVWLNSDEEDRLNQQELAEVLYRMGNAGELSMAANHSGKTFYYNFPPY